MRFCVDTEFLEDGRTIELISIGIVGEDGREYYAVSADMPIGRILNHEFLMGNVWPHLPTVDMPEGARGEQYILDRTDPDVKSREQIAEEVREFLVGAPGGDVELFAWYSAYDHVALCQLWGRMIDLPHGIPMFTRDIRGYAERLGNPQLPEQTEKVHHALGDARHDWVRLRALEKLDEVDRLAFRVR